MKQAMSYAIGEIDYQAYDQPGDKAYPCDLRQACHQEDAGGNPQKRYDRPQGDLKRARPGRFLDAQDNDAKTHQDERKKGADVCQVNHFVDVHEGGDKRNKYACKDSCDMGRFKFLMHAGKERRQEPVARHREEYP